MRRTLRHWLVLALLGWMGWVRAGAGELLLKPVADTTILGIHPANNFGATHELIVGSVNRFEGDIRARMLLRFDVSGLPPGAVVTQAMLGVEVLVKREGAAPAGVGVHRLLRDWGEGSKSVQQGAKATTGEATWNSRFTGTSSWTEPGGRSGTDFVAEASTVTMVDDLGPVSFPETAGLLEDVRAWQREPASNFGWILVGRNPNVLASARRLGSREHPTAAPTLRILYSLPEVVPFDSVGLEGNAIQLRFRANAGNIYAVWHRPALAGTTWETLTTVVSKFVTLDAVVPDVPENGVRFYQLVITGQVD